MVNNIAKPCASNLVIVKTAAENGQQIKVLIDSAAQTEVLCQSTAERLGLKVRPSVAQINSAQGNEIEVVGECKFNLYFGKKLYEVRALVTPQLVAKCDVILGISFLNKHNTSLITRPGESPKFLIDNFHIPVIKERKEHGLSVFSINHTENIVEWAKASKHVILPPRNIGYLKVRIPFNQYLLNHDVCFHPIEKSSDEEGTSDFELREGLIKVRTSGNNKLYAYIPYINHSQEKVILRKGQPIGGLTIDLEVGIMCDQTKAVNNVVVSQPEKISRWEQIKQTLQGKTEPGSNEEKALLDCMEKHQKVVQLPGEPFQTTDTVTHFIDYHGPDALFIPQYNIPVIDVEDTEKEVQRLWSEKHIRPSKSGFNAPIIPVRKRDNTLRIVNDYRALNKYCKKQRFPLPRIDHILSSLAGAKYFVVLDLKSGYHQIRLAEESIPLTAFRTPSGCWEYVRMPFGIPNAPSTCQKLMLNVTAGCPNTNVFLDDILIHGQTLEECAQNLDQVLGRLQQHKLTIKIEKCQFFKQKCRYLGHIISQNGIGPDPEKVSAVKDFPVPKDLHGVRSFLGLASYYRKFIRNYSAIAAPLHDITRGYTKKGKSISIGWTEEHQDAFCALKDALAFDAVLAYPDFTLPFILTTDSSDKACGGVLSQIGRNGVEKPITFFSRKLLPAETRYDAISRECLGIIYGLKHNRPYILGRDVTIASDNRPLLWLLQSASPNQRVARWQILISEYNITNFQHVAGKSNVVADALSRHIPKGLDTVDQMLEEIPTISTIREEDDNEMEILDWNVEALPTAQDKVTLYKQIKDYIEGKRAQIPKHLVVPIQDFCVESKILYMKKVNEYGKVTYRACLPPNSDYVAMALQLAHATPVSGHCGITGTMEKLRSFAYWPRMKESVRNYVKRCKVCLKTKLGRAKAPILRNPEVQRPWDRVNMDLIGPLTESNDGNKYILSVIDVLTRYAIAVAMPDKSAPTVARALVNHVFAVFGPPRSIYSDQGKEFTAALTTEVIQTFNVKQRTITIYHPAASGLVERYNGHLISILRALVHEQENTWDMSLPLAMLAHNTSFHRVLRETPYFLMFLRDPNLPYENLLKSPSPWYNIDSMKHELLRRAQTTFNIARRFIEEGKNTQEKYANRGSKMVNYEIGDRVYVLKKYNTSKLGSKYIGPMRIVKRLGVVAWVKDIYSCKVYRVHVDRLKPEIQISETESSDVQAAFPTGSKVDDVADLERVTNTELREAGLLESNVPKSEAEILLQQDLGLSNSQDVPENARITKTPEKTITADESVPEGITNSSNNEAQVDDVTPNDVETNEVTSQVGYHLRSKGSNNENQEWVMQRPIEYKSASCVMCS